MCEAGGGGQPENFHRSHQRLAESRRVLWSLVPDSTSTTSLAHTHTDTHTNSHSRAELSPDRYQVRQEASQWTNDANLYRVRPSRCHQFKCSLSRAEPYSCGRAANSMRWWWCASGRRLLLYLRRDCVRTTGTLFPREWVAMRCRCSLGISLRRDLRSAPFALLARLPTRSRGA